MLVTLSKPTEGGYFPETINVQEIECGIALVILIVNRAEMPVMRQAYDFARTFAERVQFTEDSITFFVKSEYIDTIIF